MIFSGANCPRIRIDTIFSASSKALWLAFVSRRPRVSSRDLRTVLTLSANLIASDLRSPSVNWSISPAAWALAAATGLPLRANSSVRFAPQTRGILCVPPAPGRSPKLISGRPMRASLDAIR